MKIGKIMGLTGGLLIMLSSSAFSMDSSKKKILDEVNGHLSDYSTVWEARPLMNAVKDQELLYNICLSLVDSGNPSNAVSYAKGLENFEQQYDIAERVIGRGNPNNGRWLLRRMPVEYQIRGVDLLVDDGHPQNAEELRGHVEYIKKFE